MGLEHKRRGENLGLLSVRCEFDAISSLNRKGRLKPESGFRRPFVDVFELNQMLNV